MSRELFHDLEIEPEPEAALAPQVLDAPDGEMPLAKSLPTGFNLRGLLWFLPDVRLKQQADAAAAEALAVDVTAAGGLQLADGKLADLRARLATIETTFADATGLANTLHKRLTGLRADFGLAASAAVETVGKRIYAEKKRQDGLAAEQRRLDQAEADRVAKENAAKAARAAAEAGASKAVVQALKQEAKVAVAPPVATVAPPALKNTSVVANWKCRLAGTPDDAEPNPDIDELTAQQQEQVRRILLAVGNGQLSLAVCAGLDWSYLNKRASAEKTTFEMLELQAFDAGGTRGKGRR